MAELTLKPGRQWFQIRLAGRILSWVVGPMILLIGINLFFVERAGQHTADLLQHQQRVVAADRLILNSSAELSNALMEVNRTLRILESDRRLNLAANRVDLPQETEHRDEFHAAVRAYLTTMIQFASALDRTELPQAQFERHVKYLTRAAGQVDRLVSLYLVANARTLRLAQAGRFAAARNNFKFEERQGAKAIQQALDESSLKFTELVGLISHLQVASNDQMVIGKNQEQRRIQILSYGVLAAVAVVGGLAALLSVTHTIIRPIRRIPERIRNVGQSNSTADQSTQMRADEIGDILKAVIDFGQAIADEQQRVQDKTEGQLNAQTQAVEALSKGLQKLSEGDLTVRIRETLPAGYGQLQENFNQTLNTLSQTMSQISEATGSIKNGVTEISASTDDLSQRTESQAATLEQTAAALDELTASVRLAADNAQSVEKTMYRAHEEAKENREVVDEAILAMAEIRKCSGQISQIISVIDDIAFQTNLLALNAGVEAARAGDAGRGFAVVASEVRGLAQRSSNAAMEIKSLIHNSSVQVERGVALVNKAGSAQQRVVTQISDISVLVTGIAEGAAEQSTGLNEINIGVIQLDQVTQKNAAMVEEATATGQLLSTDAIQLDQLVSHFALAAVAAPEPEPMPIAC